MSIEIFRPRFVEEIPEQLDDGVLYISIRYGIVMHRCAAGCGRETVNPLSPAQWSFSYNGTDVSLSPSIGNWDHPCRSHYWIRRGRVEWAAPWTRQQVVEGRLDDQRQLDDLYATSPVASPAPLRRSGWMRRLFRRV